MSDWDEDDGTNPQQILTWLEELKEKGVINEWRYKKMCDWMKDYHDLEETVRLARTPNEVHLLGCAFGIRRLSARRIAGRSSWQSGGSRRCRRSSRRFGPRRASERRREDA